MNILEGGLIQRWKKKHWPAEKCKAKLKIAQVHVISFRDCIGQFALLAAGIILAAIFLSAEYIILLGQKRRLLKKSRKVSVASLSRRVGSVPPFKLQQIENTEEEVNSMNKLPTNESDSAVYSVSSTSNSSCECLDSTENVKFSKSHNVSDDAILNER